MTGALSPSTTNTSLASRVMENLTTSLSSIRENGGSDLGWRFHGLTR